MPLRKIFGDGDLKGNTVLKAHSRDHQDNKSVEKVPCTTELTSVSVFFFLPDLHVHSAGTAFLFCEVVWKFLANCIWRWNLLDNLPVCSNSCRSRYQASNFHSSQFVLDSKGKSWQWLRQGTALLFRQLFSWNSLTESADIFLQRTGLWLWQAMLKMESPKVDEDDDLHQ